MSVLHCISRLTGILARILLIVYCLYSHEQESSRKTLTHYGWRITKELNSQILYSFFIQHGAKEAWTQIERGYCPPLRQGLVNIDDFETIFIGSPNLLKCLLLCSFIFENNGFKREDNYSVLAHMVVGGFGHMLEDYKENAVRSYKKGIALKGDYRLDELQNGWKRQGLSRF